MKKIGIVCAVKAEKIALEEKMINKRSESYYNLPFIIGTIGNIECILVQCGIGKVNAARTTQILIDKYKPEIIINAGVAGSINNNLKIGDVIISKKVFQHDFDVTAFNHIKGYVPEIGDYIECDKKILNTFYKIFNEEIEFEYKIKNGIIASGDVFCTKKEQFNNIRNTFNADIVDMECCAIAQVSFLDKIPFIGIRSISDTLIGDNYAEYKENVEFASKISSKIVEIFCKKMPN